jgi:hypothetical protein
MATYSAGLLNVGTINANGESASVNATTVNATTLNTTNMNASNFGFTNIVGGGTLSVSGDTTLSNLTASGTLGVTGASTLGRVVASGTLDVSGNTTLKNVVASGTLGVTGATTLAGNLNVSGSSVIGALDVSGAFVTRGTATMANPSFTGVPLSTTATDGTNTTQIATTAFVNTAIGTFNNVVNYLADKVYCLYLIDVVQSISWAPASLMITIKFNKEQTFTLVSSHSGSASSITGTIGTVFPYTILSTPTTTVGAKIQFFPGGSSTSKYLRLASGNRQSTITFSLDYKKIVGFKEDLLSFPTLTTANTIVNAITTPVSQSDFLSKFLVAYNANNGNTLYFVDTSGNYTADASGTRINMGVTYAADTVNWKRNVACAMMSTNSYVAMSENVGTRLQFAQMLYDGNTLVPYIQDTSGACGTLVQPEFFTPAIEENDIYNIPMTTYNSSKRLNGISPGTFEPSSSTFIGRNCMFSEVVQASGSIPAYIKHIAVRGIDVIAYNHRLHMDPSQMYYLKGRTLIYARHKQSFLNDTYWYPDGPEFRINFNPLVTVTKLICNDTEIPLHLIKTKNWDPYVKDGRAITFNIAAAIAQTGVTFKYDADTSGGYYTQSGLNKVEIWYQGQFIDSPRLFSTYFAPSTKNVPISTLMKNPKIYDEALGYVSKYNLYNGPFGNYLVGNLVGTGYLARIRNTSETPIIAGALYSDSGVDYQNCYSLYTPSNNDYDEDTFYSQFELMCPKPFVAVSGGTRLPLIESVDGNNVLYRFVPGVIDTSGQEDYRNFPQCEYVINIRPFAPKVESITLTSGKVIPYYVSIHPELYTFYNNNTDWCLNVNQMQRTIRSFEKILGPFPFQTYTYNVNMRNNGGNAVSELASGSFQNSSNFVMAHEVGHSWWGFTGIPKSDEDYWILEGTDYFTDMFVWGDIAPDTSYNYLYVTTAGLKQIDLETGWFASAVLERDINSWGYSQIGFIHATMYFNMGAEFKIDSSGNYNVKPVDASGNIAMDIFDASGVLESVGLMSQVNDEPLFRRPIIIDASGTKVYVSSDYKLIDGSKNSISGKTVMFTDGRMDLAGNVIDPFGGAIIAAGQTLTSGLKLPAGPLTSYYQPGNYNENFWGLLRSVLNAYRNKVYDYPSIRKAMSDFIDANKSNWENKWPSTGAEGVELYDEMLNTGGFRELSATNYTITFDPAYLPSGTNVVLPRSNLTPVLTVGGISYTNTLSTVSGGFKKLFNISYPIVHLEDSSGNALAGSSANFAGKDFTDKILLIKRDTVETIQSQMFLANLCGAKGIISYNNTTGAYTPTTAAGMAQLPCLGVTNVVGASILAQIRSTPGVISTIVGRLSTREIVIPRLITNFGTGT